MLGKKETLKVEQGRKVNTGQKKNSLIHQNTRGKGVYRFQEGPKNPRSGTGGRLGTSMDQRNSPREGGGGKGGEKQFKKKSILLGE